MTVQRLIDRVNPWVTRGAEEILPDGRYPNCGGLFTNVMKGDFWLRSLRRLLADRGRLRRTSNRVAKADLAMVECLAPRTMLSVMPIGPETQVNTFTTGHQTNAAIAMDAAGDYVIVWNGQGSGGNGQDIYGQRYNASGVAQGTEFRVNTFASGTQTQPHVAMDQAGDFVVVWQSIGESPSVYGIYAQRFNAAGVKQGGEFAVHPELDIDQESPTVAMDSTGNFVVAFVNSGSPPNDNGILAQRFDSSGNALGNAFHVVSDPFFDRGSPSIAMNGTGNFVVVWRGPNVVAPAYFSEIYGQRFNAAGVAQGYQIYVDDSNTDQTHPSVAIDPAGDIVIAWDSPNSEANGYGVLAKCYPAAGGSSSRIHVNTYTTGQQFNNSVAMDATGNFTVAWQSSSQDQSGYGIYAQQFSKTGSRNGSEFRVNSYTTGDQTGPCVAMNSTGGFVVAWSSAGQDGDALGVFDQRFQTGAPPLLSQIEASPVDAVSSQITQLTATLLVTDQDSPNLTGATVKISGNYQNGQDVLMFSNTSKIHGTWNAATGTMTLSGIDSLSNYRTALRSVAYHNTSSTPNTVPTRTVSFQTSDGIFPSNVVSRDITVKPSAPPVLSGLFGTANYVENAVPRLVLGSLSLTDAAGGTLASATINFSNWQAEDRVSFNNIFALQHTFTENLSTHTATLTISGSETIDHYQVLLRSICYWDVSDNPLTLLRTVSLQVSDGGVSSNTVSCQIGVIAVNDATVISNLETTALAYKANDPAFPPLVISSSILVSDPDNADLSKATVSISSGYQNNASGHDMLTFVNQNGITGVFDALSGVLTLTGVASGSNYNLALRSVRFSTSGSATSTALRQLTFTATDTAATPATSLAAVRNVTVSITNNPPALTGISSSPLTYLRGSAAVILAPNLVALDGDSINFAGARIQLTGNYHATTDVLAFTPKFGVTGSFDSPSGTLTLSGIASIANYQTILRSITFRTTTATASKGLREISFSVSDGLATSSPIQCSVNVV